MPPPAALTRASTTAFDRAQGWHLPCTRFPRPCCRLIGHFRIPPPVLMHLPSRFHFLAAALSPWLLTECSTPKSFEETADGSAGLPVVSHANHLIRATVVSLIRSPLSTARASVLVAGQRTHALVTGSIALPSAGKLAPDAPPPGSEGFERLLDRLKLPARTTGKISLLVDGSEFFPELHRAYRAACTSIDTQVFIFDNDDTGVACADLLKQRSREIPVRVLIDHLGTQIAHKVQPKTAPPSGFTSPKYMGTYLGSGSKVHVRSTTNPALLCDHTKLHVIDHRVAYVGGMNLGREYQSEWHDLMAKIEGPVVHDLAGVFNAHWNHEDALRNWTLLNTSASRNAAPDVPPVSGAYPLRILRTDLVEGRHEIVTAFRVGVQTARRRVWVHTPYLSEEGMIQDFMDAAARGVDVRIVIPGQGDSDIMQSVNENSASRLVEAGVKVYRYPGMTHMKVVMCDEWAMFGSANCDTLSLKLNRELNLASSARQFVRMIEQRIFKADFPRCRRFAKNTPGVQSSAARVLGNQL